MLWIISGGDLNFCVHGILRRVHRNRERERERERDYNEEIKMSAHGKLKQLPSSAGFLWS